MAVTLATPLPAIAFSKNPLWLELISDDYLAAAPAFAVNFFEFDAAVAVADTVILNWTATQITMTAAAVPDDSGNEFPSGDGSNLYVQSLVAFFQGNYFIDRDFVVSANIGGAHPRLIFTARIESDIYNFLTTTSTFGVLTAGVDNAPISNFMHHIEIWIANLAGGYDQAFGANVPLDENPLTGQTTIDIHETLHAFLKHDRPVLNALSQQCVNSIRAYFIKYAEFFGDVPQIRKGSYTANKVITIGGLGMQPDLLRDIVSELCPIGGDATKNRFLRQGSKNKLITMLQPEWLTFLNLTAGALTIDMEITIYNDDSTTFAFNSVAGVVIGAYQKWQFQAGFTQLGISGRQSGKNVVYYTARAKNGGGYLTDTYAYVVDYQYREWPRYLVYENSYGAFQTIGTVGKQQAEYDRTKTDAQFTIDRNLAALNGDFLEVDILIQEKRTLNIGYDRAGSRNTQLLRDLLLSHSSFLYSDINNSLIPIGFNTKNLKDAMDGVNVYANSLEYYFLYQDEVWTEDPLEVEDDTLSDLIVDAGGSVAIPPGPGIVTRGGYLVVDFGDSHLSIVGGMQVYTDPFWLVAKTNYRIYSSQTGVYFRTDEITYDPTVGAFTILDPAVILTAGDQLIIWPFILAA